MWGRLCGRLAWWLYGEVVWWLCDGLSDGSLGSLCSVDVVNIRVVVTLYYTFLWP